MLLPDYFCLGRQHRRSAIIGPVRGRMRRTVATEPVLSAEGALPVTWKSGPREHSPVQAGVSDQSPAPPEESQTRS